MDCSDFLRRYTDYDDSLAPRAELAAFRAHMDVCAPCARYDRILRKGRMLARQLPPPPPSPDFIPKLEGRLDDPPAHAPRQSAVRTLVASAAVVVALLMAGTSGLQLLQVAVEGSVPGSHEHGAEWTGERTAEPAPAVRSLTLPPTAFETPATWAGGRVDRRVASSYSPLVIGPPAYRVSRPVSMTSTAISRRTLD